MSYQPDVDLDPETGLDCRSADAEEEDARHLVDVRPEPSGATEEPPARDGPVSQRRPAACWL